MLTVVTYVYKQTEGLDLRVDAYLPQTSNGRAILYYHGGAGIFGSRKDVIEPQCYLDSGYTFLSVDYRLAPESALPQIVEDCRDAYHWVVENGAPRFGISPNGVAVAGFSFGGYMAQLMAVSLKPRPFAALSFSGYGDLMGSMYLTPDPFYLKTQPHHDSKYLTSQRSDRPLAVPDTKDRLAIYFDTRQTASWIQLVARLDPLAEASSIFPYCPIRILTPDASPTFIFHGTEDTDVPYQQALLSQAMLRSAGVPHELFTLQSGHGISGPGFTEAMQRSLIFLNAH